MLKNDNTEVNEEVEATANIETEEVVNATETTANSETEELVIALEDYLKEVTVHPGLIASFKAEIKNDRETPRSIKQWNEDFDTQLKRVYK